MYAVDTQARSVARRMLVGVCPRQGRRASEIFGGPSMEGPKVPSEVRKRRSAEGMGSGEGRSRPSPAWGSGGYTPENFSKINVEIEYYSAFLRAEMVSSIVASRQDIGSTEWTNKTSSFVLLQ